MEEHAVNQDEVSDSKQQDTFTQTLASRPSTSAEPLSTQSARHTKESNSIRCKHCKRTIANASSNGLESCTTTSQVLPCDMCKPFQTKHDAMLAADATYASFNDRRDTYGPKVDALSASRKARIDLENWLLEIDTPHEEKERELSPAQNMTMDSALQQEHGTKRSHVESQSPTEEHPTRPQVGRCDSTRSLPERKRIRFSDTVEFRDDYRPSEQYSRNEKSYQRGRYAPPADSKYLDTSGNSQSFFKFTGFKKVGKEWIDVWRDEDDEEPSGKLPKVKKKAARNVPNGAAGYIGGENGQTQRSRDGKSPREQRVARRRSMNFESTSLPNDDSAEIQDGEGNKGSAHTAWLDESLPDGGNLQHNANELEQPEQQVEISSIGLNTGNYDHDIGKEQVPKPNTGSENRAGQVEVALDNTEPDPHT